MLIRTANVSPSRIGPQRVRLNLPSLYPKQKAVFFNSSRVSICHASTKAGKTVGALTWQLCQCWSDGTGKSHTWIAPVYPQAEVAYRRAVRMLRRADPKQVIWKANDSKLFIKFRNDSHWYFKGSDRPDTIYGSDQYSVIIDEMSRCKPETWDAAESITTETDGPIRAIGNVVGRKDWAYVLAMKAKAGEPGMSYHVITWQDAVAAGRLKAEVVERKRRTLPPNIFKSLYECVPSDDGANPFGYQAIAACVRPLSTLEPVAFGVDLAKSHDWVVVVGLDVNAQVCRFARWQAPWEVTEPRIVEMIGDVPALIDSSGVGDPIVERIMRKCPLVEGYQTGVHGKKTMLVHGLIMSVQQGKVFFPDDSPDCPIRSEMESYEYSLTPTGKISYSAPPGAHDDCVIGLGLAAMKADQVGATGEVWAESIGAPGVELADDDDRMWTSVV